MTTTATVGGVRRLVRAHVAASVLVAWTPARAVATAGPNHLRIAIVVCGIVINNAIAIIVDAVADFRTGRARAMAFDHIASPTLDVTVGGRNAGVGTSWVFANRNTDIALAIAIGNASMSLRTGRV